MSYNNVIPGWLAENMFHEMERQARMSNQDVWRVVAKNGDPVDSRNNDRKNFYTREQDAKAAATQFNNVRVMREGQAVQLDDAPFSVQSGVVMWDVQ